jgi:hypothetical protein
MAKRRQHRVSEGQEVRSERPATGYGSAEAGAAALMQVDFSSPYTHASVPRCPRVPQKKTSMPRFRATAAFASAARSAASAVSA